MFNQLILGALFASMPSDTVAASDELVWQLRPVNAIALSDARTYRIFAPRSDITLMLKVFNDSDTAVRIDTSRLAKLITISVRRNAAVVPSDVRPGSVVNDESELPEEGTLPATLVVDAQSGFGWIFSVRSADGNGFSPGSYTVGFEMERPAAAITTGTNQPWQGTALKSTEMTVLISPARTPQEVAGAHKLASGAAKKRGQLAEAALQLERARAVDPQDIHTRSDLGLVYLHSRRYREAIAEFQVVLERVRGERSATPRFLAMAYLGLGDERSAAAALRQSGVPEDRIGGILTQLRTALATLGPEALKRSPHF